MKLLISLLFCFFLIEVEGQLVNEKIVVPVFQSSLLQLEAGNDINIEASGSVAIGEEIFVTGGTQGYIYIWNDVNGSQFFGENPLVSNIGTYWLTVIDENNCSAVDSLVVNDFGTNLISKDWKKSVQIYYESKDNNFYISLKDIIGSVKISIISMEGKILYKKILYVNDPDFIQIVNSKKILHGMYVISIENETESYLQKIIIL